MILQDPVTSKWKIAEFVLYVLLLAVQVLPLHMQDLVEVVLRCTSMVLEQNEGSRGFGGILAKRYRPGGYLHL